MDNWDIILTFAFVTIKKESDDEQVKKAKQTLLDRQIITEKAGLYEPYDIFMAIWIERNM